MRPSKLTCDSSVSGGGIHSKITQSNPSLFVLFVYIFHHFLLHLTVDKSLGVARTLLTRVRKPAGRRLMRCNNSGPAGWPLTLRSGRLGPRWQTLPANWCKGNKVRNECKEAAAANHTKTIMLLQLQSFPSSHCDMMQLQVCLNKR